MKLLSLLRLVPVGAGAPAPTPRDSQAAWIDAVLDLVDSAQRDGEDFRTAHYVFARRVLGEPRSSAMALAIAFRHHPLTRVECAALAHDWWLCDRCDARVEGGTQLCEDCATQAAESTPMGGADGR